MRLPQVVGQGHSYNQTGQLFKESGLGHGGSRAASADCFVATVFLFLAGLAGFHGGYRNAKSGEIEASVRALRP